MTTLTTQSTKTTALTLAEADANFAKAAQAKIANYTTVEGDNRDTIECTGTFTVTLPVATTIAAAADTGDYEVTIKNVGTGKITVDLQSTDTFDGTAAQNDYLTADQSKTYKVNQPGDGYNIVASVGVYNEVTSVTTGTTVDLITTIPVSATKITLSVKSLEFSSASTSPYFQLGNSTSYLTTTYDSSSISISNTGNSGSGATTNGIIFGNAADMSTTIAYSGHATFIKETGTDVWNCTGMIRRETGIFTYLFGGRIDVTAVLTRIRIGSGGFDGSGTVTVIVE